MKEIDKIIQWLDERLEDWKKEAGEIPENTCPSIDKVISEIEGYVNDVNYLRRNAYKYDNVEELANNLPDFGWNNPIDELDTKLRKDNERLRELGRFWYEKCKEIKDFIINL